MRITRRPLAKYAVLQVTDTLILIKDTDDDDFAPSVTNAAAEVVEHLCTRYDLKHRKIFYQDTLGQFDELLHLEGHFIGFAPCTENQRVVFNRVSAEASA